MGSEHQRLPESVPQNTSTNLGDILKFKEDNHSRNNVTIGTVLNLDKRSSGDNNNTNNKVNWKKFRGKICLKRAMQRKNGKNQMMSSARMPKSDPDIESESSSIRSSSSLGLQKSLSSLSNEDFEENDDQDEEEEENESSMSLMSLLAETDREMGIESAYVRKHHEAKEVEEVGNDDGESGDYNDCCICMVRHKGSAFIPCGHTFCSLCSRELYVQRGNCPICNGYILEILDIF